MNKSGLVAEISRKVGIPRVQAGAVIDSLVETIESAVKRGEKVSLVGFGTFEARKRAARKARNPRTGEVVRVKPTTVPVFRPGATFRSVVAGKAGPKRKAAPKKAAPKRRK